MSDRIILSRAHRDALYRGLLNVLDDFEELLALAIGGDPEDLEGSERIGRRLAEALRLIQDGGIGWGYPPDAQDTCQLTLPPDELRRIIEARRASLAALEETERAQHEKEERHWGQTTEARAACDAVLDQLGGR